MFKDKDEDKELHHRIRRYEFKIAFSPKLSVAYSSIKKDDIDRVIKTSHHPFVTKEDRYYCGESKIGENVGEPEYPARKRSFAFTPRKNELGIEALKNIYLHYIQTAAVSEFFMLKEEVKILKGRAKMTRGLRSPSPSWEEQEKVYKIIESRYLDHVFFFSNGSDVQNLIYSPVPDLVGGLGTSLLRDRVLHSPEEDFFFALSSKHVLALANEDQLVRLGENGVVAFQSVDSNKAIYFKTSAVHDQYKDQMISEIDELDLDSNSGWFSQGHLSAYTPIHL